jgi:hypothetical protein
VTYLSGVALSLSPQRVAPWVLRALWVALPFTVGPALGEALDGASRPVQLVASTGLWTGWGVGVVATAVALPVSLTALRLLAPAAAAVAVAAGVVGHVSPLALGWAAVTTAWTFTPAVGAACVNGPAYPNERRYLLRAPGSLLVGPLALAWGLAVAGLAAGPLLLAAKQWVWGGLALVVGLPLAGAMVRGMHELSRRWAVFVPAGLVLHDPLTIVDPVLLPRQSIARLGPAAAAREAEALDLSQKAPGLVLEIDVDEDVPLALVRPGRRLGEPVKGRRLLITPTRPGAVLDEARRRRFRVT